MKKNIHPNYHKIKVVMTDGEECHACVIGIGMNSQWGVIKSNLVTTGRNDSKRSQKVVEQKKTPAKYVRFLTYYR